MPATTSHSDVVESVVSMPIVNPETGRASRSFDFYGVVDKVDGRTIIDWKSTDDPARFIHQHRIGLQAELYALALSAAFVHVDALEYRLIRKPTIRFTPATVRWAVVKEGRKSAIRVLDEKAEAEKLAKLRSADVERRVTGDLDRDGYEDRCFEWLTADAGNLVEHRHVLTPSRLEQARHLLWTSTKRILDNRKSGHWMANENACFSYNRECECLPLCDAVMGGADLDWVCKQEYEVASDVHPELGGVDCKRGVLTYSSCKKLRMCEMKYYWQIERGLRKRRAADSDALWLGSAIHKGLEAYSIRGESHAMAAIDEWAEHNPVIGEDQARKQDQEIAKARAMVRAAALKWPA